MLQKIESNTMAFNCAKMLETFKSVNEHRRTAKNKEQFTQCNRAKWHEF